MALKQPVAAVAAQESTSQPASGQTFSEWLQDPMGSVIAASVATISTFGIVLGGIWSINVALT